MNGDPHPKPSGPDPRLARLSLELRAPLQRYFRRQGLDVDDAEDLTQETFARLLRSGDVDQVENPRAFVFSIATNLLRDKRRRDSARRLHRHDPLDEATLTSADVLSPERRLIGKQDLDALREAIEKMPAKTRTVFLLHRFDGLRYREIGEVVGISMSAVEKHMMAALVALAKAMDHSE